MSQSPAAATQLIEWFGSARGEATTMGGKAASLDRLARLGFAVPPGFSLTTAAFDAHLAAIADMAPVRDALSRLPEEAARVALVTAVADAPLPARVSAALGTALDRLVAEGEQQFAVRSSAIGEDGADASYAGLHATELGVTAEGVAAAVQRCWASLLEPGRTCLPATTRSPAR